MLFACFTAVYRFTTAFTTALLLLYYCFNKIFFPPQANSMAENMRMRAAELAFGIHVGFSLVLYTLLN